MSNFLSILPDLLILVLIYIFLYNKYLIKKDNETNIKYSVLYLSFCIIFLITLWPFVLSIPNIFAKHDISYNFIPFVDWQYQYGNYISETFENILLFIPFGFSLYYATKKRPPKIILYSLLLSLCIEVIQPLISEARIGDITDIINNTLGASIGCLISYLIIKKHN